MDHHEDDNGIDLHAVDSGKSIVDYHEELDGESVLHSLFHFLIRFPLKAGFLMTKASASMAILLSDNQRIGIHTRTASSSKLQIFFIIGFSCLPLK